MLQAYKFFASAATHNLIPYFHGCDFINMPNGHLPLYTTNCSSVVMCLFDMYATWNLLIVLSNTPLIGAYLSVGLGWFLVVLSSKWMTRRIWKNQSLAIVVWKIGPAKAAFVVHRFATPSFLVLRIPETLHKPKKTKSCSELISFHRFGIQELPSALVWWHVSFSLSSGMKSCRVSAKLEIFSL